METTILPTPIRIVRFSELKDRLGLSKNTIRTMIAEGRFPMPFPLGKRVMAWTEEDVVTFINSMSQVRTTKRNVDHLTKGRAAKAKAAEAEVQS